MSTSKLISWFNMLNIWYLLSFSMRYMREPTFSPYWCVVTSVRLT